MLDSAAGQTLVQLARRSLARFVLDRGRYQPDLAALPTAVSHLGCSFVTLTNNGQLRGCIGGTEPRWSLAEDVARHAAAAAHDPRFTAVQPSELAHIRLEVTILTPPQTL
ncbi:MAG: AMMECR1 domain-containing protein, partial [Chloroflexi bacterium]|nr:AMMECR1 domain-containing protein [Chloroflexota bacterium]